MAKNSEKLLDLFARAYVQDFNASAAAERIGKNKSFAATAMRNEYVKQRIEQLQRELSRKLDVSAEYVISTIVDTIERCKQAQLVTDKHGNALTIENSTGELVPAYTFDAKAVLRGCELLGKHLGLFSDKVEVTVNTDTAERLMRARLRANETDSK
jgi:phage terminase small subunit